MKSLIEKKDEIVNFWEIEEESIREKLIEEIRAYSELKEEGEFVSEIRANFNQINNSGIGVIYEALCGNPKKWSSFFRDEYIRAFESAKKSNSPFEILECLEEISVLDESQWESRDEIIKLLESYLSHENDAIRYKAIWNLGEWMTEDNEGKYAHIVQKIIQKLKDSNWKIRYATKLVLDDMEKLPKDFKLSFWDKLRIKHLSPFNMK